MVKRKSILFLILVWCAHHSFCQEHELITGIVVDSATFSPLPYVNIQVKNTSRGTNSDAKGNFSIMASRKDTLLFSFVGYRSVQLTLRYWEPSMVRMAERPFVLQSVTIRDTHLEEPYYRMFDEENARLKESTKKLPFYYPKYKKEKIKVQRLENENLRVKTYVDVVVNNAELKGLLMEKHKLTEQEYYAILTKFNERNYTFMYYLTASELLSLLYRFYEIHATTK